VTENTVQPGSNRDDAAGAIFCDNPGDLNVS